MNIKLKIIGLLTFYLSSNLYGVTLDGHLNDPEWAEATLYNDFVIVSPFSLGIPEYKTEARLYTNEEGIYIGITNFQPQATQKSERSARDSRIEADSNTVIIDFDNTAIAAYSFEVGNGGSMHDGIWRNETSLSDEWNGVWSMQTSSDEDHWYSEYFIPWDVAPMVDADDKRTIGLHITRQVADLSKKYASAPIDNSRQRFLSEFSTTSINDFSGSSLQIFGYATARQDRVAKEDSYDAGVDIFWKPSSSKQLSVSINPDFGHVDTDNLVVNFSPTETFFSENRPFFTENQAIFDLSSANGLRLIHTRRIGGRPDTGTEIGADILAALKFTSVGDNFNYGFFSAIEDGDAIAEGRNYYAGRAVRKTDDYSVGYLLTYTDRPDIARSAIVQAVDYSYDFSDAIKASGQVINTNVDSPSVNSTDNGLWVSIAHQISPTWDQALLVSHYGDEFEVNDLGFLGRNDLNTYTYYSNWQDYTFADSSIVQDHEFGISLSHEESTQNEKLESSINITDSWSFKNTSNANINFNYNTSGNDDLVTRGNGNLNIESGANVNLIYFADRRNKFQWHIRGNFFDNTVGGNGYFVHFHPSYQISDNYLARIGFTYTDSEDWLIWQGGTQLNNYAQERLLTEFTLAGTISDKQEISLKFEWIALKATGQNTYGVNGNGNLVDLNTPVSNFNLSDVALQLRYRYEIAPLSNIYVVYSRGGRGTTNEESSFSSLFSPGWEARDGDNFIVKVRYQF